ncbi:hypothetical protein [Streptomyces sp. NPDC126499]|uniref:hypothetical protein n=1 Tax=Streptomyces sp. NPDC126499 TaxID=3155314 RepID=UPI00332F45EF
MRTRPERHCTYCTHPNPDCCVRVQPPAHGGRHIYAHLDCAAVRGVWPPLYVFLSEAESAVARAAR